MKRISLIYSILVFFIGSVFAQNNDFNEITKTAVKKYNREGGEEIDYNYQKHEKRERKPVQYPSLREADVIFAKRVVRIIDSREKKNQVMNWPQNPLSKIINNLVTTGEYDETGKLRAYKNDSFKNAMTVGEVSRIGGDSVIITIHDPKAPPENIYETIDVKVPNPIDVTQIKRWQITEDWYFDKQRSIFFPRIIAVAPMYQPNLNDVLFPEQPMYYINYADLRPLIVNEEVFNRQNDVRTSYFDFFELREFSSYITKVSNDKDFFIKDFPEYKDAPLDALLESERQKNELVNWEQDLWEQ